MTTIAIVKTTYKMAQDCSYIYISSASSKDNHGETDIGRRKYTLYTEIWNNSGKTTTTKQINFFNISKKEVLEIVDKSKNSLHYLTQR